MGFREEPVAFIPSVITSSRSEKPVTAPDPATHWRASSFSGNNGTCVEVAALPDGHIATRNSKHPDDGNDPVHPRRGQRLDQRHQGG